MSFQMFVLWDGGNKLLDKCIKLEYTKKEYLTTTKQQRRSKRMKTQCLTTTLISQNKSSADKQKRQYNTKRSMLRPRTKRKNINP